MRPGDDLAGIILDALARVRPRCRTATSLVVAQKIVSKAEDRFDRVADGPPVAARAWSSRMSPDKDPRLVELILRESSEVLCASAKS